MVSNMNNYDFSIFDKGLEEFNITLNDTQYNQFIKFYELLVEWNSFMNLTAITEWDDVIIKHFLDSLSLSKFLNMTDVSYSVLDLGTGAGFPGIPLKIAFPNLNIVLMDSLNKRVKFLNTVIDELGLEGISAVHGRAEEAGKSADYRESFDLVLSRAVANLSVLSEYCLPFVKINGMFISYKSDNMNEELDSAVKAINILGGCTKSSNQFILPESDFHRNIIMIDKVKSTPNKFPRKAGVPAKEPL